MAGDGPGFGICLPLYPADALEDRMLQRNWSATPSIPKSECRLVQEYSEPYFSKPGEYSRDAVLLTKLIAFAHGLRISGE